MFFTANRIKHTVGRPLALVLCLLLLIGIPGSNPVLADDNLAKLFEHAADRAGLNQAPSLVKWSYKSIDKYCKYFSNHVDGYRLIVQRSMEADMSASAIRSILRDSNYTIEIYRQNLDKLGITVEGYSRYSNHATLSSPLNEVLYYGEMSFAGMRAYVLEWSRSAYAGVENDQRYYASVDLELSPDEVLSFLFKSSQPFDLFGSKYYILVLNTLSLLPQSVPGTITSKQTVVNPPLERRDAAVLSGPLRR